MSLKSSSKVGTNRYQLEVAVDADVFEKAVDEAYHRENKKIMIPGFRKGKAPRAFVEKYYGEKVFYDDAINAVYPDAMQQAVEEAKLEMIEDKIDFDLVSAGKDGLVFKATITTKPEVEIEDYKGIAATKKPVVVTDADVDAEVEKVRERNSRMVTVEDRTAQDGDIAVIDFEGSVDGVPFEGGKGENYSLTLGAGQFIPGFEEQVVGHKTGEEFDISVKFPEDYQAKELAGKDSVFHIHLHEIKMKELPTADDDFVKDVSEFNTLEEYRADIRAKLTEAKERESKDDVENQLIDKLAENLKAEIPPAMFENRIDEDVREFGYRLQSQGLNLETYMKYTGQDEQAIRGQFRGQAERQVKVRLALEKIVELEKIHPSEEDIENEYKKLAENYKMDADKVKNVIPEKDLVKDIAVEKAVDFVRDNAVVTEAKEEKPEKSEKNDKKDAE
jgi:trigger factor